MPPFTVYILYYRLSNTNKVVQERETAAMDTTKKQITVIAASNAASFERQANRVLKRVDQPRLIFDKTRPYLLYIIHNEISERK